MTPFGERFVPLGPPSAVFFSHLLFFLSADLRNQERLLRFHVELEGLPLLDKRGPFAALRVETLVGLELFLEKAELLVALGFALALFVLKSVLLVEVLFHQLAFLEDLDVEISALVHLGNDLL